MQRRDFVRNLAVGAVAVAAIPSVRWLNPMRAATAESNAWSGPAFSQCRGSSFSVCGADGAQTVTLDEVIHRRSQGMETASLRFKGDSRRQLAQGCYEFSHPQLGRMPILIVPGSASGETCFYRAIFNRFG
jgi:hypothetical protein